MGKSKVEIAKLAPWAQRIVAEQKASDNSKIKKFCKAHDLPTTMDPARWGKLLPPATCKESLQVGPNSYTIVVALPGKALSPNFHGSHWVKDRAVKAARMETCLVALRVMGSARPFWKSARVDLDFYFPQARRRDRANFSAATKAHMDGLQDAGLILDDSGLTFGPVNFHIDPETPRLQITVTRTP